MKKNNFFKILINAIIIFSLPITLYAQGELKPGDFDGAFVLSGKEGSLLVFEIPPEVYQGLRQGNLGDIRIFDSSERPVSFSIREKPGITFTPDPEEVPFFIWDGGKENEFPAYSDIEINTAGGVVRIKNQGQASDSSSIYLLDFSFLEYSPSTLWIEPATDMGNFNTAITINYSLDLASWHLFDKKQVLASFNGKFQNSLELPKTENFRYILVGFERGNILPLSMKAFFGEVEKAWDFHEIYIQGEISKDKRKANYNTGSFIPIETIDFLLSDADSIQVLVKNRLNENDEWVIRAKGNLFRFNTSSGTEKNAPFNINSHAPYWELETAGDLLFSSAPECLIRVKPREIIFPGRGEGPWTFAYGNAECGPPGKADLLSLGGREELEPAFFTGEKRYERSLLPSQKEGSRKAYMLWAFLGAAVIVLSILAFSIAKSMKK